jgi:pimeloyl-ACP methyl ester carboxylesterase
MSPRTHPVLLLHSGGLSSRQWDRLASHLSPSFRVLAPDFLGYGRSRTWPRDAPFGLDDDASVIEALLDGLGEPAHLVGHSYGGLVALRIALRREVRSLALYEPVAFGVLHDGEDPDALADLATTEPLWHDPEQGGDEAWLRSFVDYWRGAPGSWDALPQSFRRGYLEVGRKVYQEAHAVWSDRTPLAAYAALAAPTLILSGARSPLAERRVCARLAAAMPHAALLELPDAGHMGPLTDATVVSSSIAAHLARSSA